MFRADDDMRDELGPFATGLGGAIAVAGSLMPWGTVTFQAGPLGVMPSKLFTPVRHVMGTHTLEGKVTLAIALFVALLGIVGLLLRGRRAHIVAGATAALGAAVVLVVGITEFGRVSASSRDFNPLHYPLQYQGVPFRHIVDVSTGIGLDVLLVGAALALAGSLLVTVRAWRAGRRPLTPRHYTID